MFCLVYFYNNRMRPDINLLLLLIYYFIGLNIGLIVCSIVFLLVQLLFSQKNCITIFYILSRSYNAPYIFFSQNINRFWNLWMLLYLVIVCFFYETSRISRPDLIFRYISCHYTTRSNNTSVTNLYSF